MTNPRPIRTDIITKEIVEYHKRLNAHKPSIWWTYVSLKEHLNSQCTSHSEYDYGIKRIVALLEI